MEFPPLRGHTPRNRCVFQERELHAAIRGGGLDIRQVLVEALPKMSCETEKGMTATAPLAAQAAIHADVKARAYAVD